MYYRRTHHVLTSHKVYMDKYYNRNALSEMGGSWLICGKPCQRPLMHTGIWSLSLCLSSTFYDSMALSSEIADKRNALLRWAVGHKVWVIYLVRYAHLLNGADCCHWVNTSAGLDFSFHLLVNLLSCTAVWAGTGGVKQPREKVDKMRCAGALSLLLNFGFLELKMLERRDQNYESWWVGVLVSRSRPAMYRFSRITHTRWIGCCDLPCCDCFSSNVCPRAELPANTNCTTMHM